MKFSIKYQATSKLFRGGVSSTKFACEAIRLALDHGLAPLPLDADIKTTAVKVPVDDQTIERIKQMGDGSHSKEMFFVCQTLEGLCNAHIATLYDNKDDDATSSGNEAVDIKTYAKSDQADPFSKKEGQLPYYTNLLAEMKKNQIVLAEGATGIGKSRVIARVANDFVRRGVDRVVISAPQIAIMKHIYEEWVTLGGNEGIDLAITLGKAQFFVPEIVEYFIEDEVVIIKSARRKARLLKWLDEQAPPLKETGTERLLPVFRTLSYLVEDLLYLAPEFSGVRGYSAFDLQDEVEDKEMQLSPVFDVILDMNERVAVANIVLASHVKLAYDIYLNQITTKEDDKDKKKVVKLLGEYSVLLLDEGHQFEQAIANINTHTLSILSLAVALKRTALGSKANRSRASKLCMKLQRWAKKQSKHEHYVFHDDFRRGKIPAELIDPFQLLSDLHDTLGLILKTRKEMDTPGSIVRNDFLTLWKIVKKSMTVRFDISPRRNFLSIATGQPTHKHTLERFWASLDCAGVISGTLTLPDARGKLNANFVTRLLNIPPERVAVPAPVRPKWVTDPIILCKPEKEDMPLFLPPKIGKLTKPEMKDALHFYCANVAEKIFTITLDAKGGSLILLTSFQMIKDIKKLLVGLVDPKRIVAHKRNSTMQSIKAEYIRKYKKGLKPIWLALGGAWTGLDLVDEDVPPEEDNLCSLLCIVKIPFGTNRSFSARVRSRKIKDRNGKVVSLPSGDKFESAFTLRQGIGRVVRRQGCPDKPIWILDSRIWLYHPHFYRVFQQILDIYTGNRPS